MILHDFQCASGHVSEHFVRSEETTVSCPQCSHPAQRVFLSPPKLDWAGMAMGPNAGPEFVDRFARVHKEETERQGRTLKEHGDYGPGYAAPPSRRTH